MRIGAWIGAWDPDVPVHLRLMRPLGNIVVAEGAWGHIDEVREIAGPLVPITMRDTWQRYGGDEGINEWLQRDPDGMAQVLATEMLAARGQWAPNDAGILLKDLNEPPTTTIEQCRNLNRFTVRFGMILHEAKELHHGLHGGEGNPPGTRREVLQKMELLREAHDVCDFTGWHLYRKAHEGGLYHEYRYRLFPLYWDRGKHLATEGLNIEPGGWRAHTTDVDEVLAIFREMAGQWRIDGIGSVSYFALKVQTEKHFATYYGDKRIYSWIGQFNALEEDEPMTGDRNVEAERAAWIAEANVNAAKIGYTGSNWREDLAWERHDHSVHPELSNRAELKSYAADLAQLLRRLRHMKPLPAPLLQQRRLEAIEAIQSELDKLPLR